MPPPTNVTAAAGPSLAFFSRRVGPDTTGLVELPIKQLDGYGGIICVPMRVNGVEIPALLDTGAPVTVLNSVAALAAGFSVEGGGETVEVDGPDGPALLRRIARPTPIALGDALVGPCRPFVGEVPGLAALEGLTKDAGPAAVLGNDVLRLRDPT